MDAEQQNRAFFAAYDPDFLKELEGDFQDGAPEPAKKRGYTLNLNGKYVHSKYDPIKEAEKAVAGEACICHVHFGLGLGYFLQCDQTLDGGSMVVFEPDRGLAVTALKTQPLADLVRTKNVRFCCSLRRLKELLTICLRGGETSKFVVSPYHGRLYPELLENVKHAVAQIQFSHDISLKTLAHSMPMFTGSALKCLKYTTRLPGVQKLKGLFANVPAVLVSPGPSLEKNLGQLKACRSRCLVISLARSAALLEKYGIEPDLLVHNEPQPFFHLIEKRTNLRNTTFVLAEQAEPAYYAHDHSHTFVYGNTSNLTGRWVSHHFPKLDKMPVPSGGSVANDAFAIAHLAGCNPIILIGQDLSLREDRYYARSDSNQRFPHSPESLCKVPAYHGGVTTTVKNYMSFLFWFQDYAEKILAQTPSLQLINATEGGAKLAGMEQLKFSEVIWRFCQKEIQASDRLAQAAVLDESEQLSSAQLSEFMQNGISRLRDLRNFCRKFKEFEPKLRRKLNQARTSDLSSAAKPLHVFEDFKDTYVKLQQGFQVLSGFLQADLQKVNQAKRARKAPVDLKTRIVNDLDDCSATFKATSTAVEKALPLFLEEVLVRDDARL